ncbi:hypothetical protein OH809_42535 [Streptomyces sp. NBC_00873]|uniref:hypothetical protein n=1 Tax=unclassified Streptomyces TaxID=2593676 RepID=UPI00386D3DA0|nr:hypothetical protein OH809_01175 [Streptomyces sp. NBC_00873]WSY96751.1 hypothetical protein OH809_42535 [Streptomyces sp. NBC_00873]WTA41475.1 hypothetical protein OH821_01165 [Streptomyces sp. NBC_00842]WTA48421.1 hypothetical protein OH821_42645 [Streptomyces sp. NBC_00842]
MFWLGESGMPLAVSTWKDMFTTANQRCAEQGLALRARGNLPLARWAASRAKPLLADVAPEAGNGEEVAPAPPGPLIVTFNRIKTSAEARRTKRMGGHLPSAAKSNTAQVLYTNYLRPDPTIREWAEEVMGEALVDAEQAARTAHERAALKVHEERSRVRGGGPAVAPDADATGTDTAWGACTDHDHHPETGRPCQDSFLACFHCGNCLITRDKLPRLLALLDAMHTRLQQMDEDTWWKAYGPTWTAIRRDVLPKFSPAEVAEIRKHPLPDALLDLVESPWEHP